MGSAAGWLGVDAFLVAGTVNLPVWVGIWEGVGYGNCKLYAEYSIVVYI